MQNFIVTAVETQKAGIDTPPRDFLVPITRLTSGQPGRSAIARVTTGSPQSASSRIVAARLRPDQRSRSRNMSHAPAPLPPPSDRARRGRLVAHPQLIAARARADRISNRLMYLFLPTLIIGLSIFILCRS